MKLLVTAAGVPYLMANLISIAAGSLVNFLIADQLVFLPEDNNRSIHRRI